MQPRATHLYRSRHDIWYFRWLVPTEFRQRHPGLPKELKRSTQTADTRRARGIARRLHCALLLHYGHGKDMSSSFDGIRYSGWTLKRDPVLDRISQISVGPDDTPEMLARLDRVLDIEASRMQHPSAQPIATAKAATMLERFVLIGEAIDRYGKFQIQTEAWSENTFKHAHEPSLRLFKELVGQPVEVAVASGGTTACVDRPLHEVTRQVLELFIEEFWSFPAQQGKVRVHGYPTARFEADRRQVCGFT